MYVECLLFGFDRPRSAFTSWKPIVWVTSVIFFYKNIQLLWKFSLNTEYCNKKCWLHEKSGPILWIFFGGRGRLRSALSFLEKLLKCLQLILSSLRPFIRFDQVFKSVFIMIRHSFWQEWKRQIISPLGNKPMHRETICQRSIFYWNGKSTI